MSSKFKKQTYTRIKSQMFLIVLANSFKKIYFWFSFSAMANIIIIETILYATWNLLM